MNKGYRYKILFVCTGNIFRSLSAKSLLQKYLRLKNISDVFVDSAGIVAKSQKVNSAVKDQLNFYGVDISNHKQKKLNAKLLEEFDLVVAMGKNHQEFIEKNYNKKVPLFLKIVKNKDEGLKDDNEIYEKLDSWLASIYVKSIVKKIYLYTPRFYANFKNFIVQ